MWYPVMAWTAGAGSIHFHSMPNVVVDHSFRDNKKKGTAMAFGYLSFIVSFLSDWYEKIQH
jgi:hypothetical protein